MDKETKKAKMREVRRKNLLQKLAMATPRSQAQIMKKMQKTVEHELQNGGNRF